MPVLNAVLKVFLMPGDTVLKQAGVTIEEDGGILRSFINMCFWGVVTVVVIFAFY